MDTLTTITLANDGEYWSAELQGPAHETLNRLLSTTLISALYDPRSSSETVQTAVLAVVSRNYPDVCVRVEIA